jgi:hypothetical protein
MNKTFWAALGAVAIFLTGARPSAAAIVQVTIVGFLEGGNGPNGLFYYQSASAHPTIPGREPANYNVTMDFTFDTSLGHSTTSTLAGGGIAEAIDWQPSQGGLSPLLSANLSVFGNIYDLTGGNFLYNRSPATAPSVSIGSSSGSFSSTYFSLPEVYSGRPFLLTDSFPFTLRFDPTGDVALPNGLGGTGYFAFARQIVTVPEPATWGLLVLGFGTLGAVLRRRDRTGANQRCL